MPTIFILFSLPYGGDSRRGGVAAQRGVAGVAGRPCPEGGSGGSGVAGWRCPGGGSGVAWCHMDPAQSLSRPHAWIRRNTLWFSMRDYLLLPGANPSAVDLDVAALCRPITFASSGSTSAYRSTCAWRGVLSKPELRILTPRSLDLWSRSAVPAGRRRAEPD